MSIQGGIKMTAHSAVAVLQRQLNVLEGRATRPIPSVATAFRHIEVANYFGFKPTRMEAEAFLIKQITPDNVHQLHRYAKAFNAPILQSHCERIITAPYWRKVAGLDKTPPKR
jgi:hypothetical protein